MKTHARTLRSSFRTPGRLGWVFLLPALALSLPAQTGPEIGIQQSTNGTCLLTWPVTAMDYVVLSATNIVGPWQPVLNHVTEAAGTRSITVAGSCQCQYFRLVEGYYDDFEDGDLDGWMLYCMDPAFQNVVNLDVTNGQLRIHGTWSGDRRTFCLYTNLTLSNCVASMDLLDWANGEKNQMNCSLLTRFEPGVVTTNRPHYHGGTGRAGETSSIWLYKQWPDHGATVALEFFPKTNPANDYRLIFRAVGGQGSVELYDLTDLSTPVATVTATDNHPLAAGWPGIFANDKGSLEMLDVTVDNYFIYALP